MDFDQLDYLCRQVNSLEEEIATLANAEEDPMRRALLLHVDTAIQCLGSAMQLLYPTEE